jgi:hypothetical protein
MNSARAQDLLALGNVELLEGTFASEADLRKGFRGCDGAFVNIDGFNCGEKTEIYWAIRCYELALEEGIKFYVYGNLDYVYKKSGYVFELDDLVDTNYLAAMIPNSGRAIMMEREE